MEENVTYTIYSDCELPEYDISVRLYWSGDNWTEDVAFSLDFDNIKEIVIVAKVVKANYPKNRIFILKIISSMATREFEVFSSCTEEFEQLLEGV